MEFKKYSFYTVEDFLEDVDFRHWVFRPTPEANSRWQAFFEQYPGQREVAGRARALLLEMQEYFQPDSLKGKPIDEYFIHQLKRKVEAQPPPAPEKPDRRLFIRRLSIAACLLMLIGSLSWYWLGEQGDDMQVYATEYGERKTFELPDGSIVVLNAHSELRTAKKWKKGADRLVWLDGEAHFTVMPQPVTKAKFSVITNDLNVNVLGTVFNVYAREKGTQVTLEEGRVSLDLKEEPQAQMTVLKEPILMSPGEQVQFSAATQVFQKEEQVNVVAKSSWKDGVLILDGLTLKELGVIITETFGYPVEFKDTATMNQGIGGSVPAENDLDLLLETVDQAFDEFEIVKKDNRLIFE